MALIIKSTNRSLTLRFPGYPAMVEAGLLLPDEAARLAKIDQMTPHETTWYGLSNPIKIVGAME